MKVIINANVILEDGIIFDGVVEIIGDKIGAVCKRNEYLVPLHLSDSALGSTSS